VSDEDLRRVLRRLRELEPPTLEELLTGPEYFGLETATPLQRAVCLALDGLPLRPELLADPEVQAAFGPLGFPRGKPTELDVLSGIRSGKSLLVAALAVRWSQSCDLASLRPGEPARVSVVSVAKDNANVVFSHLLGGLQRSAALSRLLVEPPGVDSLLLRHPSGRAVEVKVVAGSRAGSTLVSRWSAGCIFDEYTRMVGQEEGVVNYEEQRAAVLGRLLPGAQIASIGSPYASTGPAHARYLQYWGRASEAVCVVKAPGWAMNPLFWTPSRCQKLKEDDPDVWRTDCAAEFSTADDAFFTAEEIQRAIRKEPVQLDPVPAVEYVAAMDPATRGNGWSLVVVGRYGGAFRVALACEWRGSKSEPLSPESVLREVAEAVSPYRVTTVLTDQVMGEALTDLARQAGLFLHKVQGTPAKRLAQYTSIKLRLQSGELELPPVKLLREDLLRVRKRVGNGAAMVVLPETADGRHCDYAPSLALAMSRWLKEPEVRKDPSEAERVRAEIERSKKALAKRYGQKRERV
jgi:hypothetical protein